MTLEGVVAVCVDILTGDRFGVACRKGEGLAGESGLRKGDALGDPKDRGEGLYEVAILRSSRISCVRKSQ